MKMKIVVLISMITGALSSLSFSQTTQNIMVIPEKKISFSSESPFIDRMQQRQYVLQQKRETGLEGNDVEVSVTHFLDTRISNCSTGICFGMVPAPALYFQTAKERIQFFSATTGTRTIAMFRWVF